MVYCHQTTLAVCLIVAALLAHSAEANLKCDEGPGPVNLGTAGDFVILAKAAVSTTAPSVINGDVGLSPAAQSFLTGFSLTSDGNTEYSGSTQVTGKLYAANDAPPTPAKMTTAIGDMESAYTDAAGRDHPDHVEYMAGALGGTTPSPGLYKFGTGVGFAKDCTLSGSSTDTWIFQIAGDMSIDNNKQIILAGGALARNIVWVVAGKTTFEADSHFEGTILGATSATFQKGSSINGRVLVQTNADIKQATVNKPM